MKRVRRCYVRYRNTILRMFVASLNTQGSSRRSSSYLRCGAGVTTSIYLLVLLQMLSSLLLMIVSCESAEGHVIGPIKASVICGMLHAIWPVVLRLNILHDLTTQAVVLLLGVRIQCYFARHQSLLFLTPLGVKPVN